MKEQLYMSRKYEEMKILYEDFVSFEEDDKAALFSTITKRKCPNRSMRHKWNTFKWSVRTNSFRCQMLPTIMSSILNKARNSEQVDCHFIANTGNKNRNKHLPKYIITLLLFFKEM